MPAPKGHKSWPNNFRDHPENINRKGRPKVGLTLAEMIRDAMESTDPKTNRQKVDELIDVAMARAKRGHWQFWDSLMSRGYGKAPDVIEFKNNEKPDLSKLSDKELTEWTRLLQKAKPG